MNVEALLPCFINVKAEHLLLSTTLAEFHTNLANKGMVDDYLFHEACKPHLLSAMYLEPCENISCLK